MDEKPLEYEVFREFLKAFDINPLEFRNYSGDKVMGYFPDLPERKPSVNVKKLTKVLWK